MNTQSLDTVRATFFAHDLRAGGAERSVIRLANAMVRRNIPVELVLINRTGAFLSELDPQVSIFELSGNRTATSIFSLYRYIKAARPQFIIASMTHINAAVILASLFVLTRPFLIVVEHNQYDMNLVQKSGLVRLAYRLAPLLYRFADVVAGVSEGVRVSVARAMGVSRDTVSVLYNPVVTPELTIKAAEPARHDWLISRDVPVILAVGRLMPSKNYPLMLEAFSKLRSTRPVRLIVLGEGKLRPDLESLAGMKGISSDVDFVGFRDNPLAFMKACDVFLMSSDWEGHPTVLIEAMACGAPIVSTDCRSGPGEILCDGSFGRLVPVGDAEALADAVSNALDDPGDPAPRIAHANTFSDDRAVTAYLSAAGFKMAEEMKTEAV
ncbi:MAG: glycosyltransferase [Pseudoruegeria sp.]